MSLLLIFINALLFLVNTVSIMQMFSEVVLTKRFPLLIQWLQSVFLSNVLHLLFWLTHLPLLLSSHISLFWFVCLQKGLVLGLRGDAGSKCNLHIGSGPRLHHGACSAEKHHIHVSPQDKSCQQMYIFKYWAIVCDATFELQHPVVNSRGRQTALLKTMI